MKVKDIMTKRVICAPAEMPVGEVAELLAKNRISAVPIRDDSGAVVGLVSEYDLMAKSGRTARDIMTPGLISVSEDADVDDVRFLLIERRIKRVPVMAGSELIGIVSRADLVRLMALQWVCQVCGDSARGDVPPEYCVVCRAGRDRFVQQPLEPGM